MPANVNFDKNFVNDAIPVLDEAGDTIEYEFSVTHQGGTAITRLFSATICSGSSTTISSRASPMGTLS